MKKGIHPEYYKDATVKCSCGNTFKVGSTLPELHVEICSKCHPFYTGKQKLVDTARRVEKFEERSAKKSVAAVDSKKKKVARRKTASKQDEK